ncbi:hypothetical protein HMPREF9946_04296 [Acetobacteraceae bacterium AT-5844]|nr:hypothetical protein HMPREF9946_04296 [Acetobacteraceae bacterium AT-5844]
MAVVIWPISLALLLGVTVAGWFGRRRWLGRFALVAGAVATVVFCYAVIASWPA